jgi:hypothetical protein
MESDKSLGKWVVVSPEVPLETRLSEDPLSSGQQYLFLGSISMEDNLDQANLPDWDRRMIDQLILDIFSNYK